MLSRISVVAVLCTANLAIAQDAGDWLERMGQAGRSYVYSGTVVFVAGSEVSALRVSQVIDDGRVRQHALNLMGPPQTVVAGGGVAQRSGVSDAPPEYLETPLAIDVPVAANTRAIRANYQVEVGAEDRVAGRPVRMLSFVPLDRSRYARHAWVDVETGLPLRNQIHDGNRVLEQMLFTDVQVSRSSLETAVAPSSVSAADWPGQAPQGFELRALVGNADRRQWVFTDGLAVVSVFAERGTAASFPQLHANGATGVLTRDGPNVRWTAIGDVPDATLQAFLSAAGEP